jgi:hypothetical protein
MPLTSASSNELTVMETEIAPTGSSHFLNTVFFNDRGLRAGWRLLIYCGMIAVLIVLGNFLGKQLAGTAQNGPKPPESLKWIFQVVGQLIFFLLLLLLAWIMSKIERRKMGAYGLPLQRSLSAVDGAAADTPTLRCLLFRQSQPFEPSDSGLVRALVGLLPAGWTH